MSSDAAASSAAAAAETAAAAAAAKLAALPNTAFNRGIVAAIGLVYKKRDIGKNAGGDDRFK